MNVQPLTHEDAKVLSVLREDGSADPAFDPGLPPERVAALYEAMLRTRAVSERLAKLADEGRIGLFPPRFGAEAAIVGATSALREQDWIFPAMGDFGAAIARGLPLARVVARAFGGANDELLGRDVPAALGNKTLRIASASAPAATHLPHAVGLAWAAQRRGEDLVSAAFFDACEIDAADFHTGLNFAGVMKVPTIFVCRVGQGEASAAEHAVAYGLHSVRCDGSDLLAVVRALRGAVQRASEGGGASVVDLALGSSDEALSRARAHAQALGAWDEAKERAALRRAAEDLASAIDAASRAKKPPPRTIFDDVYARVLPHLQEQREALESTPGST